MKIGIFVNDITTFGGVEYISTILARQLNINNDVDIVSLRNTKSVFFDTNGINLQNISIPSKSGELKKKDYAIIDNFFKKKKYDKTIVQLSTVFKNLCPLADIKILEIISKYTKGEVVFHESPKYFITRYNIENQNFLIFFLKKLYTIFYYNPRIYYFMKKSKKYTTSYVTLSRGCQEELKKYFNINSSVRYNPYFFDNNTLDISEKQNIVLWAGRFSPEKNLKMLIDAWKNVNENVNENNVWTLQLIGNGDQKEKILKYIKANNIANVEIFDAIPHEELMNRMDFSKIFVLPSFFEAFPTVIPESMNRKNVVICTKYDGYSDELVLNEKTGFVINFDSIELCQKIIYLIKNEDRLRTMQEAAYNNCFEFYKNIKNH